VTSVRENAGAMSPDRTDGIDATAAAAATAATEQQCYNRCLQLTTLNTCSTGTFEGNEFDYSPNADSKS